MSRSRSSYHHGHLRQALLDAAHDVLEERGIDALSLREVARRAGVSPSAPYHHFQDRAALLSAMAVEGHHQFAAALRRGAEGQESATAGFRAMGVAYVVFALEDPARFRLLFRPDCLADSAVMEAALESYQVMRGAIDAAVGEGGVAGDPENLALTAWASVHGLASLFIDGPMAGDPRAAESMARSVVDQLGAGFTPR